MYICIFAHKVDKDATNIISLEISFFIYIHIQKIFAEHTSLFCFLFLINEACLYFYIIFSFNFFITL